MSRKLLTVVTPTFNRAYILDKCYKSLKQQTNKSFIWMIIDDGSTDNTEELVNKWINESLIEIIYFKKSNNGKASALNMALDHVNTEYFVCLDSDDIFTNDAVEIALQELSKISDDKKVCGILALRNALNGEVLGGKRIPTNVHYATVMDITDKYNIRSEFIQFYKTSIITKYRFPVIQGEKFISPEYISMEINRKYLFNISQSKFCICEYLPDGLTQNKIKVIRDNPKGYTLVKRQSFELSVSFRARVKHGIMFIAGSMLSGDKKIVKNSPYKIMTILLYPFGWLAYRIRFKAR